MNHHYDLLIVGGGINGCALARAAALRGIRTALVEKRDFGAGVTSRSTRLIHGGLRYLESFQVALVRESLRDREALLHDYPGQIVPIPFLLPVYRRDSRPPWYLGVGLALYRLLASGRELPPHRRLSATETLALAPGLDPEGLLGGFEYYDCQAVYPERVALEMALQAEELGARIRNYARVTGFLVSGSRVEGVRLAASEGPETLRCRLVVNAAGAWVDEILRLLPRAPGRPLITLVNGAHIAVQAFPGSPCHAVYHEARSDRRPFFVVPWRGLYLIGTTETPFNGNPDRARPEYGEVRYLIDESNNLFPEAGLGPESVLYAYSGSRPLLRADTVKLNRASRGHAVVDHERTDGIQGLLTMAGGKLTTAPSFAEEAVRRVERKLGLKPGRGRRPERVRSPEGVPARLAGTYGARATDVVRSLKATPELAQPVAENCETTCGEVLFAVEREKARTLGDILLRRTGLAFDPRYERSWAERVAATVAPVLGWDGSRAKKAVAEYEKELASTLARGWRTAAGPASRIRLA